MKITELIKLLERWKEEQPGITHVIVSTNDWGGATVLREEDMEIDLWQDEDGTYGPALNIHRMG